MGYKNSAVRGHCVSQVIHAQRLDAGSGIQDNMGSIVRNDFNARGTAAVSNHVGRTHRH
jgi:hypothetical protein